MNIPQINNHQLADLLVVAKYDLSYCKSITDYPEKNGFKHFDTSTNIDAFYKSICNVCFHDSLLITATLLDKDPRVISFWNRKDFVNTRGEKLTEITELLEKSGLKTIRDQIVGHADTANETNNYPFSRKQGIVNKFLIKKLDELHQELVALFRDVMATNQNPYSEDYFNTSESEREIEEVLDKAKPKMTNSPVV